MTQTSNTAQTATTLAAAHGDWRLDPTGTTVKLQTKSMWGLAKVKADFKATAGSASVTTDGAVTGSMTIDAASVSTGIKKRDDHLRSADFLEVDKYPSIAYTVRAVTVTADNKAKVDGELTVRGVTRNLALEATVADASPDALTLVAEVDLDRADWQITWAKMGARLDNHLVIRARFAKAE
jgi:polyisoprenoid-binding protein YceI